MPGDVLCFSHLRWTFVYQRPNHLMSRCARARRVFFVEEPIFDAAAPHMTLTPADDGPIVAVPRLPPGTSPAAAVDAQRALVDALVAREEIGDPLLWFYTPMALAFARHLYASAVIYDCMDELSAFRGAPPELCARERELFARADLVFTGGESLYEAKRAHHPHVHAFPSSVDAAHFARARGDAPEPFDQRAIPRPRLGFFGVIDERMDLELLARVADLHPEWHVVLIGPTAKIDPASIPRRANVHHLGMKEYADLPHYLAGWDVAIMPFARNDATRFISPTKTLEYLAAGRPVVSTPIRDVVRPYGDRGIVHVAEARDFVRAVEGALAEAGTPAAHARRAAGDALVARTSWDGTWARMSALIDAALARAGRGARREEEASRCSTT